MMFKNGISKRLCEFCIRNGGLVRRNFCDKTNGVVGFARNSGPLIARNLDPQSSIVVKQHRLLGSVSKHPTNSPRRKVLVVGNGAFSIGQGGEFNYICVQCIKALKSANIEVVLINPNVAAVLPTRNQADKIYLLPIILEYVEKIIEKESPDGIIFAFSGNQAASIGYDLHKKGILKKHGVEIIGPSMNTIEILNNRKQSQAAFATIGQSTPESKEAFSIESAEEVAEEFGYPVVVRFPCKKGEHLGLNIANNKYELDKYVAKVLIRCPWAMIEKSLRGWKEVQYQVMRDSYGECMVVSSLESVNPLGVHTGDSIVVSPIQTLSEDVCSKFLSISKELANELKIVGICDIKFAINPKTGDIKVIEVSPVPSRSSVLGSKATGCPMAFIATKILLGESLKDFGAIHSKTSALNSKNIAIKMPKWDFRKFPNVSNILDSSMKSTGEVMAVGCSFEEALQKAIRMSTVYDGLVAQEFPDVDSVLSKPTDKLIFAIITAMLNHNYTVEKVHELTLIDKWFLEKIKSVAETTISLTRNKWFEVAKPGEEQPYGKLFPYSGEGYSQPPVSVSQFTLPLELLKEAKMKGFSDKQIANLTNTTEEVIRSLRISNKILPKFKKFHSSNPASSFAKDYIYSTYFEEGDCTIEPPEPGSVIVLGAGSYKVGSSVESDWCALSCVKTLSKNGKTTTLINCNPGTMSTDFDSCDHLFFEEPTFERVMDIYEFTRASGCIISVGGQVPQIIALGLHNAGVNILGTGPIDVDSAEDREKFSKKLDKINIKQPKWRILTTKKEAIYFAESVSYPVVIRPSYILSGTHTWIAHNEEELSSYFQDVRIADKGPVLISKLVDDYMELDIEAVSSKGELWLYAVSQQVENAGIHSGDSITITPPMIQKKFSHVLPYSKSDIVDFGNLAKKIAKEFNISGSFNMQLAFSKLPNNKTDIKVIECNIRSSRSVSSISLVLNKNLAELSTLATLGMEKPSELDELNETLQNPDKAQFHCVRVPVFSWNDMRDADPKLGTEMKSTGEVSCFSKNIGRAYLMALLADRNNGFNEIPPRKGSSVLIITDDPKKREYAEIIKKYSDLGYRLISGNHNTTEILGELGMKDIKSLESCLGFGDSLNKSEADRIEKELESKLRNVLEYAKFYKKENISLVLSLTDSGTMFKNDRLYLIRRSAVESNVTCIYNAKAASFLAEAILQHGDDNIDDDVRSLSEWYDLKNEEASEK